MADRSERLRSALAGPSCTLAASVFDPLSARIAELQGWSVCKLSGSVAKAAAFGIPDDAPIASSSDLAEICSRITRMADVSLVVDVDDAGGDPVSVWRTVRDLEHAGAAGIEIEDTVPPVSPGTGRDQPVGLVPVDRQVANLEAAVAARRDPGTVIIARTGSLSSESRPSALERIRAYGATGVDAIMVPGPTTNGLADISVLRTATRLPFCVLGLPHDVSAESLRDNGVTIRYLGLGPYRAAVRAIHDALSHLRGGGDPAELSAREASPELLRAIVRSDELSAWSESHRPH